MIRIFKRVDGSHLYTSLTGKDKKTDQGFILYIINIKFHFNKAIFNASCPVTL